MAAKRTQRLSRTLSQHKLKSQNVSCERAIGVRMSHNFTATVTPLTRTHCSFYIFVGCVLRLATDISFSHVHLQPYKEYLCILAHSRRVDYKSLSIHLKVWKIHFCIYYFVHILVVTGILRSDMPYLSMLTII